MRMIRTYLSGPRVSTLKDLSVHSLPVHLFNGGHIRWIVVAEGTLRQFEGDQKFDLCPPDLGICHNVELSFCPRQPH